MSRPADFGRPASVGAILKLIALAVLGIAAVAAAPLVLKHWEAARAERGEMVFVEVPVRRWEARPIAHSEQMHLWAEVDGNDQGVPAGRYYAGRIGREAGVSLTDRQPSVGLRLGWRPAGAPGSREIIISRPAAHL